MCCLDLLSLHAIYLNQHPHHKLTMRFYQDLDIKRLTLTITMMMMMIMLMMMMPMMIMMMKDSLSVCKRADKSIVSRKKYFSFK